MGNYITLKFNTNMEVKCDYTSHSVKGKGRIKAKQRKTHSFKEQSRSNDTPRTCRVVPKKSEWGHPSQHASLIKAHQIRANQAQNRWQVTASAFPFVLTFLYD